MGHKWCNNRWVVRNREPACSHIVLSSWCLIYKHPACLLVSVSRRFNGINYPSVLTAADMCVVCNTPSFERQIESPPDGRRDSPEELACAETVRAGCRIMVKRAAPLGAMLPLSGGFLGWIQLLYVSHFHRLPPTLLRLLSSSPQTINVHIRSFWGC